MEEVVRNVTEIEATDRRALEHLLGHQLNDDERVAVRVVGPDVPEDLQPNGDLAAVDDDTLPEWCNVYEGLSDEEIAAIEEVILTRANLTRAAE